MLPFKMDFLYPVAVFTTSGLAINIIIKGFHSFIEHYNRYCRLDLEEEHSSKEKHTHIKYLQSLLAPLLLIAYPDKDARTEAEYNLYFDLKYKTDYETITEFLSILEQKLNTNISSPIPS